MRRESGRRPERGQMNTETSLDHLRDLLNTYMERKGLRSTEQRRLIIDTFFHAPAHITIEDLLGQVRTADPRVGYATVYRTLKLLAESGVASEPHFGDGVTPSDLPPAETHPNHLTPIHRQPTPNFQHPHLNTF